MAIETLYPAIRPSLNLDFANSKTLDPRITFSRASAATYYDGKTVAKAEENLLTYSQDFEQGAWAKGEATVTANTDVAPDGTATADSLTAAATVFAAGARVVQDKSSLPAGTYTFSVWLKRKLGTGGVSLGMSTADTPGNTVAVSLSESWQRFSITAAIPNPNLFSPRVILAAAGDSIAIWGAQLEQRSQVTAYTPTTTQPITNYVPVLQTAPAGVPRFDHNPVTGESLGLLVEEQRTNLLTRSQEFDLMWGKMGSAVLTNILVSPDGTLSADKIIADTTSSSHRVDGGVVLAQNSSYTFSCFAKAGEYGGLALNVAGASAAATYNLIAGTVTGAGGTVDAGSVSAAIQPVGNGWYRCIFSFTWLNASITSSSVRVCLANSATNTAGQPSFTGDGYSGIYIWGAQLEAGAFPTSYIKTEASQVTRAADVASMTGANFSSWYRQDEGTFYFEASSEKVSSRIFTVIDAVDNGANQIFGRVNATSDSFSIYTNGAQQFNGGVSPGKSKIAGSYAANNAVASISGSAGTLDNSVQVPQAMSKMYIGSIYSGGSQACATIKKLAFYPKALPGSLQALTA